MLREDTYAKSVKGRPSSLHSESHFVALVVNGEAIALVADVVYRVSQPRKESHVECLSREAVLPTDSSRCAMPVVNPYTKAKIYRRAVVPMIRLTY